MISTINTPLPTVVSGSQYKHTHRPLVAIDCIVFGYDEEVGLQLLLVKRHLDPEKGRWALMGGLLDDHENLDQAAQRILYRLTGMTNVYLEELKVFSHSNRDPVERTISVTYTALVNIHNYEHQITDEFEARWFPTSSFPELIFDHNEMVRYAKQQLKYKANLHPIGFELLPERFTFTQLRKLYDAIYETQLDKGNFRRMMLATGLLVRLKEKDKTGSKKGAYFYQLDTDKYTTKLNNFYL